MNTYTEMNEKIVGLLGLSDEPMHLYAAQRIKELEQQVAQFQHPIPANKSIADLNHIIINACMNLYAITEKHEDIDKIINAVKSFTAVHPVPYEAGEVYVWETKNPEQDLFRHPIINLTEKCHDLGWFDTKRGYWVDENGDSLGQCEWLRLSPAPPSGEDAGKGIGDLKQDLFDFFLWFRENGDLYIDKSIENMISIYIKTIHTNV